MLPGDELAAEPVVLREHRDEVVVGEPGRGTGRARHRVPLLHSPILASSFNEIQNCERRAVRVSAETCPDGGPLVRRICCTSPIDIAKNLIAWAARAPVLTPTETLS